MQKTQSTPNYPAAGTFTLLKVTYFALIVFVLETVFFRIFNYIHDYFDATLIISYVVLGIGLGAFVSSKVKIPESRMFGWCSLLMTISLYGAFIKTVSFASAGITNAVLLFVFLFPAMYISKAYTEQKSHQIYLFDMTGCFLGVVFVVICYKFLSSETIFFSSLLLIPLVAFMNALFNKMFSNKFLIFSLLIFSLLGSKLTYNQVVFDSFNLFNNINYTSTQKTLKGQVKQFIATNNLVRTYENLVGRIDITGSKKKPNFYVVSYDGWSNDDFDDKYPSINYENYKKKKWPLFDVRFLYGNIREPQIFIIGSGADGIIKSIKKITPPENIVPVEINPAILEIMQKDYYEESGKAYENLNPILGNAISLLKSTDKKYDMITLINTHSSRNIAHRGPPDYLHTIETYNLLFDRLTDDGYLMFEERPEHENGRLALYRIMNTLYHSLKSKGFETPEDHFIIWTWRGGGGRRPYKKYTRHYYTSIVVSKNPIVKEKMETWVNRFLLRERKRQWIRLEYFNGHDGVKAPNEFTDLFKMIKSNNFSPLQSEDFDSSIATNNRPFVSHASVADERRDGLIVNVGIMTLIFWIIFSFPLMKSEMKVTAMSLNFYNVLIGFAFFLIEIILFQVYQNVFISPASSFVFVLGLLLFSSGIGGCLSGSFSLKKIILLLIPVCFITINLPNWLLSSGLPFYLAKISGVTFILITGFLMGMFFPKGLKSAKEMGLQDKIFHFYAINAASGCFAVVFALYLGIKIGYVYTVVLGLAFYLSAGLILLFLKKPENVPV